MILSMKIVDVLDSEFYLIESKISQNGRISKFGRLSEPNVPTGKRFSGKWRNSHFH